MDQEYAAFLAAKAPRAQMVGRTEPVVTVPWLFDFQQYSVEFCARAGRAAMFLGTGLGKSRQQARWCEVMADRSLILAPLAVVRQFADEATSLGILARPIRDMTDAGPGVNIANYDIFDKLDVGRFGAVSLDESSVLASFEGKLKRALVERCQAIPYRLCASATPAPNDHMELGNHAAFLGVMSAQEMLARWFINDTSTASQQWRLKKAAASDFWDWVASWAVMAESPEDLGFDGSRYVLPPMTIVRHRLGTIVKPKDGELFGGDVSATQIHETKRQTAAARADVVAELVAAEGDEPWLLWCDTDAEANALAARISGLIEVRGSHSPEQKAERIHAFATGEIRYLVTKPSIAGAGVNLQRCARMCHIGRSFSFRLWYQSLRRCWRFGQTREVIAHLVVAQGEEQIGRVLAQKEAAHAAMRQAMIAAQRRRNARGVDQRTSYQPTHRTEWPTWLTA